MLWTFRMPGLVGGTVVPLCAYILHVGGLTAYLLHVDIVRWSVLCPTPLYPAAVRC